MRPLLLVLATCSMFAADAVRSLPIVNGSMSQGIDTCTGWDQRWNGGGKLSVSRDSTIFKVAPASLCLATDGEAKGNVFQFIDVPGGSTIDLTGCVRSEGTVKVLVFVQSFDAEGKPIDYQLLRNQYEVAPDWVDFNNRITIPAAAVKVGVGLAIDGNGKAWLDEVRNTADRKAK